MTHPELAEADKIADPFARTLAYARIAKKARAEIEAIRDKVCGTTDKDKR